MSIKFDKTKNTSHLYLFGEVNFESCKKVISELNAFNADEKCEQILLTICSTGGRLNPCFALYDHILLSAKTVFCLASGFCGSSAIVILQAGKARFATSNTRFKLHSSTHNTNQVAFEEFERIGENFKIYYNLFVKLTTERSGVSTKEFEKTCIPVKYLSTSEALNFGKNGLIDEIWESV